MRRYGSFLVRWWLGEHNQQRVSIRHVQSDEELTFAELSEALAWMAGQIAGVQRAPPAPCPGSAPRSDEGGRALE